MPPPRFYSNPNRDYVLLNDAGPDDDDARDPLEQQKGGASAARLFALARPELLTITFATLALLVASLTQVRSGCLVLLGLALWACFLFGGWSIFVPRDCRAPPGGVPHSFALRLLSFPWVGS